MGFFGRRTSTGIYAGQQPTAEKQRYLKAVRRGGYGKTAAREQRRLDALNRRRGQR